MLSINIDTQAVDRALNKIINDRGARRKMQRRIGERGKQLLESEAGEHHTTGKLVGSMGYKVQGDKIKIGSDLNYAHIVMETGRGPGKPPPVRGLKRWAAIKLGDPKLAYAVAKSIARRGTKKFRMGGPKRVTRVIDTLNKITIPKELDKYGRDIT